MKKLILILNFAFMALSNNTEAQVTEYVQGLESSINAMRVQIQEQRSGLDLEKHYDYKLFLEEFERRVALAGEQFNLTMKESLFEDLQYEIDEFRRIDRIPNLSEEAMNKLKKQFIDGLNVKKSHYERNLKFMVLKYFSDILGNFCYWGQFGYQPNYSHCVEGGKFEKKIETSSRLENVYIDFLKDYCFSKRCFESASRDIARFISLSQDALTKKLQIDFNFMNEKLIISQTGLYFHEKFIQLLNNENPSFYLPLRLSQTELESKKRGQLLLKKIYLTWAKFLQKEGVKDAKDERINDEIDDFYKDAIREINFSSLNSSYVSAVGREKIYDNSSLSLLLYSSTAQDFDFKLKKGLIPGCELREGPYVYNDRFIYNVDTKTVLYEFYRRDFNWDAYLKGIKDCVTLNNKVPSGFFEMSDELIKNNNDVGQYLVNGVGVKIIDLINKSLNQRN